MYFGHGESPLERYDFLTTLYREGSSSTSLILSYISLRFLSIIRILSLAGPPSISLEADSMLTLSFTLCSLTMLCAILNVR